MTYQNYGQYNFSRSNRWQDWANLVLAIWLFFSPWILQFTRGATTGLEPTGTATLNANNAAWNAWVLGVIVFFVALSAISRMEFWQEWITLILGAWIFLAPWALGFANGSMPKAAWNHWIVGGLIFIFSLMNLASARPVDSSVPRGNVTRRRM